MTTEIATALIGVAGTLLGTILGWVLSNLSQMGKLIFTESQWEDRVQHNKLGQMVNSTLRGEAQLYSYELILDVVSVGINQPSGVRP